MQDALCQPAKLLRKMQAWNYSAPTNAKSTRMRKSAVVPSKSYSTSRSPLHSVEYSTWDWVIEFIPDNVIGP